MEKVRRKIRIFWAKNGKSLLEIVGIIALIVFVIRGINGYVTLQNEESKEETLITQEQSKQQQKANNKIEEDEKVISVFIDYCNSKNIEEAYKMLSDTCKQNRYTTMEEFEHKYINQFFKNKKEYEIIFQENNTYKITFLEDILQSGSIKNRNQLEDYCSVEEDVFGNKTININLHNEI